MRPGGHAYYMEVVDTGVEAPGKWLTEGSGLLGLHDEVQGADLGAVLAGVDPADGSRLGRHHDRVAVAGFDLTFCAPKSVSLLHALGEPEVAAEVRGGHEQAVREALGYVEQRALAVRRSVGEGPSGGPGRAPVEAQGVAAGGFLHRTSRALDPHLHTHVVVANLGLGPDGTWSALDGRGVYAHIGAAGSLYQVQLRYELTRRLRVSWEPPSRGRADICGIGPEVRREFSQRAAQIQAHLAERGLAGGTKVPSGRARDVAGHATRAARDPNLAPEQLRGLWEARARDVGLSPRLLEATLDRVPRQPERDARGADRTDWKGLETPVRRALGELDRSVTRRDTVRAWCSVLDHGAPVAEVERAADSFLEKLEPVDGWAGERDAPGVGERRHSVTLRSIERDALAERRRMERHLAERGMSRAEDHGLGLELGL